MNRRINIIDYDEVARAMAASSQTKGKCKSKVAGGSAATPARSNKTSNVPAVRKVTGSSISTPVKKNKTSTVPAAIKATGGIESTPVKTNKTSNSPVARKVAGSSTSTPVRPNKISSVPAARKEPRAPVTAIPSQHLRGQLYKANGLKILLNDQDGLGDKKRQHARLAKSLLHNDLEKLLDIVEQYAGTEKQIEFCILELSKVEVATWIEQKETLALGRHPKSTLPSKSQSQHSYRTY